MVCASMEIHDAIMHAGIRVTAADRCFVVGHNSAFG